MVEPRFKTWEENLNKGTKKFIYFFKGSLHLANTFLNKIGKKTEIWTHKRVSIAKGEKTEEKENTLYYNIKLAKKTGS